ncbi:MAG: carbamoyltransferase HypF, partial [bacterium]
ECGHPHLEGVDKEEIASFPLRGGVETRIPSPPHIGGEGQGEGAKGQGIGIRARQRSDLDIIEAAARLIRNGGIVALKGLGGFQLACDAADAGAVERLRARKRRAHKPFAVMLADMEEVRRHCRTDAETEALLRSTSAPIVLLPWIPGSSVVPGVAPAQRFLGVMLPYTPLHHLLVREAGRPLVMTSGNFSEEPIAKDNDEALERLAPLADAFLLHDRGIYARYDDSVWFVPLAGRAQPVRRARGYAPYPVRLSWSLGRILGCGAELKNTFCLGRERYAFVSQHIGDMENVETLEHFESTVEMYERLFRSRPEAIACDLHPNYLASRYGRERSRRENLPLVTVQHHHAHVASCLADNDRLPSKGAVLGVALDGTGYGPDGAIWGGEFLVAGYEGYRRFGHLEYVPLPGGDAAVRKPYRMALAYCLALLGRIPDLAVLARLPRNETVIVERMIAKGVNTPLTSSCGRLFDAVSALAGVCLEASFEGQAAMELESAAAGPLVSGRTEPYPFSLDLHTGGTVLVRLGGLFEALADQIRAGASVGEISYRFHVTVACMVAEMCGRMRAETGLAAVALSGGCFQNRLLLRLTVEALEPMGFEVLTHRQVPCNDGGLSLGQAAVAAQEMNRKG